MNKFKRLLIRIIPIMLVIFFLNCESSKEDSNVQITIDPDRIYKWTPPIEDLTLYHGLASSENLTIESKIREGKLFDAVSGIEEMDSKMFITMLIESDNVPFKGICKLTVESSDMIFVDHQNPKKFLPEVIEGRDIDVFGVAVVTGKIPTQFFPVSFGAKNLHIIVNNELGYTTIAGLNLKQDVTVEIWDDGTVVVDKGNVRAESEVEENIKFISKEVQLNEQDVFAFFEYK